MGFVVLVVLLSLFPFLSVSMDIKIYNGSSVSDLYAAYSDDDAYASRRSNVVRYMTLAYLVYSVPRNACAEVSPIDDQTYDTFALIPDFDNCSYTNIEHLKTAGYYGMITYSPASQTIDSDYMRNGEFLIVIVKEDEKHFIDKIKKLLDSNTDNNPVIIEILVQSIYQQILFILCIILMVAVLLSIFIFLCSYCSRLAWNKWKNRGLTRWRIRQLPQRRYDPATDITQTCSICLEDFKNSEKIRILPCDHIFHPKCVDEWLQNWNRTCPLCKKPITRRNVQVEERGGLLSNEERETEEQQDYGALEERVDLITPPTVDSESSTD
jgi:E3 ubiquitin-protein ligase RNF13